MLRLSLNGQWVMRKSTNKVPDKEGQNTAECISKGVHGRIPGSVYSFLLGAGLMEDPYYRDRELDALQRMEEDYSFSRVFIVDPSLGIFSSAHQCLHFDGIDTLSEVRLNGVLLGRTDNMHITWEFDIKGILREGNNTLEVTILSPTRFIRNADREYHLGAKLTACSDGIGGRGCLTGESGAMSGLRHGMNPGSRMYGSASGISLNQTRRMSPAFPHPAIRTTHARRAKAVCVSN